MPSSARAGSPCYGGDRRRRRRMKIENLIANPLPDQNKRLTHEARKWVAQTFFGTMLKQMRDSPFKSELFAGGRGGQAFGTLLDQQLADRMSRGAGGKLVDGI